MSENESQKGERNCDCEYKPKGKPIRILSIDGGGIRGIIPLIMLAEIEKRTGKRAAELFDYIAGTSTGGIIALGLNIPHNIEKEHKVPKYSANDILDIYLKKGDSIFASKANSPLNLFFLIISFTALVYGINLIHGNFFLKGINSITELSLPIYTNTLLLVLILVALILGFKILGNIWELAYLNTRFRKYGVVLTIEDLITGIAPFAWIYELIINFADFISKLVKNVVPTTGLDNTLDDIFGKTKFKSLLKPTIITAYKTESRMAKVFNSKNPNYAEYLIKDLAKSTSAAPMCFPAHIMEKSSYIDGGVFANNPLLCVYVEVLKDYECKRLEENKGEQYCNGDCISPKGIQCLNDNIVVISLGTGGNYKPYLNKDIKRWGLIKWGLYLFDIVSDGINDVIQYQMSKILQKNNYFRLQPTLDEKYMKMDNATLRNILGLKALAEHYVCINNNMIEDICKALIGDDYDSCCDNYSKDKSC